MDADGFEMNGFGTWKHSDGRPPDICTDVSNRYVSTGVLALVEFARKIIPFDF
jgi:hypothetical protein